MMMKTIDETAIWVLKLWIVALLTGLAGAARAQEGDSLQPQGLDRAGIYALRQLDPGLSGAGVRFGVVCRSFTYNQAEEPQNDYRPNAKHNCFETANLHFFDTASLDAGVSPHSTAICSILFGGDPRGIVAGLDPFVYEGAVPDAEAHIYEFQHFVTEYVAAESRPSLDVLAASFGYPFETWWTRGIESWAEHEGLPVVASIGNGADASNPPFYPGAGSNAIGVGVVSSVNTEDAATNLAHFSLAYPERSSWGPTEDGRCKPDLIAPGNCLAAGTDNEVDYIAAGDWSSFSAPVAAGVVGLLVQVAKQDRRLENALSPEGGNCVVKAILMNSATKLPFWHKGQLSADDDHEAPLDYVQGAGMVNAVGAYQLLKAGQGTAGDVAPTGWDLDRLDSDRSVRQVYRFVLDSSVDKVVTATLTWNRHYRRQYPFERIPSRDSDLRLEVWAVDPENSDEDDLLGWSDSKADNVEHVYVEALADYTMYEIVVSHSNLDGPAGAGERYALAWGVEEKLADESFFWHDLNADGIVDQQDFGVLMNNWIAGLKSPEAYVIGDVNKDGHIDVDDMQALYAERNRRADWHTGSAPN